MKNSLLNHKVTKARYLVALFCLLGGGVTQPLSAQEGAGNRRTLPNALQRGINVSHIWGGMEYWQSQRFAGQSTPRYPMIYDGPTTETLFQEDNAGFIFKKGFGHVRFFFDPLLCGYNFGGTYIYPSAANITPGMAALIDDIRAANEAGLAVVLNFFPYWISPEHNYRTVDGKDPGTEPWKDNPGSWRRKFNNSQGNNQTAYDSPENPYGNPNFYPGPWRKDFAMHYGPVSGITQNHPLPRLWKGITEILKQEGISSKDVYLQPISEAQTGFGAWQNFGTTPNLHVAYVDGENAFQNRYLRWRKIQLETIKAIASVDADYNVLVTSQESFPWSYLNQWVPPPGAVNTMSGFNHFAPYSTADGLASTENLIYTFHMYSPYDFTHNSDVPGALAEYVNKVADEATGPIVFPPSSRDDYQPSPPATTSPHVRQGSPYHYNGALLHFNLINQWYETFYPSDVEYAEGEDPDVPPMMITEFGAWRKAAGSQGGRDPLGAALNLGELTYDDQFPLDYQRARWVYDIRTLAQQNNYGWTYFDYSGGFRAFEGRMFGTNHTNVIRETTQPSDLVPRFKKALFEGPRP